MDLKAKCRIIGIKKDDVLPGEVFQPRDDEHGRELVEAGIAEEYDREEEELRMAAELEEQGRAKAELLASIAAAQTVDELELLIPEEEPEAEVAEAFRRRIQELEEAE